MEEYTLHLYTKHDHLYDIYEFRNNGLFDYCLKIYNPDDESKVFARVKPVDLSGTKHRVEIWTKATEHSLLYVEIFEANKMYDIKVTAAQALAYYEEILEGTEDEKINKIFYRSYLYVE